jgi:hypothetical protein
MVPERVSNHAFGRWQETKVVPDFFRSAQTECRVGFAQGD